MLSQKQQEIIRFSKDDGNIILSAGSVRSGKTFSSTLAFLLYTQALREPNKHLILGRKLRVMEAELLPLMNTCCNMLGIQYNYKASTQTIIIGRHIYFVVAGNHERSLDRIQGLTAHSALIDEVTLIPESFFDMALSRLTFEDSKAWLTCNPSFPGHYIKKKWLDEGKFSKYIVFRFDDNPTLSDIVKDRFESQFSGVFKKRMVDAQWAAAEGLVYPYYEVEDVEYDTDRRKPDRWFRRSCKIGADYGTANPTAYIPLLTLVKGKEIKYHVPESIHIDGGPEKINKSDKELADTLVPIAKNHRATAVVIDPNAASFELELVRHPRRTFAIRRGYRPVLPGIRITNNALEKKLITISPKAESLLDELESYAWDPEKDEAPLKQDDHNVDALRYVTCDVIRNYGGRSILLPKGM